MINYSQGSIYKHFFILGAAKCGTTSLYFYLNQHPQILMSSPKETVFFEKEYEKGLEYYLKTYFPHRTNELLLGDARHRNLYLPYVPRRIANFLPDAKLIVILRNPVDRAYSHYIHRKVRGVEPLSFKEAIKRDMEHIEKGEYINTKQEIKNYIDQLDSDGSSLLYRTYIDCGYYAEQIERYLKYFNKEQLLIVFFDDLIKNNKKLFHQLLSFLDNRLSLIDIDFSVRNKRTNKLYLSIAKILSRCPSAESLIPPKIKNIFLHFTEYLIPREAKMNKETRSWLISHYLEHNKKLEVLTGRNLSSWNH